MHNVILSGQMTAENNSARKENSFRNVSGWLPIIFEGYSDRYTHDTDLHVTMQKSSK